jgi:predicted TIM-barrel fold metal-dependent hydrolase
LRRCVTELGFVGALIDSHIIVGSGPNGTGGNGHQVFHDSPAFDKLWSTAVDLGVPIYLHPAFPPIDDITSYGSGLYAPSTSSGSFTYGFAARLGSGGWGWHSNTGLSFLKLYGAGVFDRFPKLQIVLGHMGEMVPYYLWRADRVLSLGRAPPLLTLRQVYQNNVHVTTAGFFSLEALHTLLNVTDTKRIMYSVDYPLASNEEGKTFMETLRTSGLVSTEEYKDIAYRNAQRLLQL